MFKQIHFLKYIDDIRQIAERLPEIIKQKKRDLSRSF